MECNYKMSFLNIWSFQIVSKVVTLKEKILDGLNRNLEVPLEVVEMQDGPGLFPYIISNIFISFPGRGVIAKEAIPINSFVCEYKATGVYSTQQYRQREKEYLENDEIVANIEAKVNGKIMHFDATRRLNQFGRYINHSTVPNIKPHPPLFVRGKYCVGFYSTTPIAEKEEIVWDYNDRNSQFPWLSKGT